MSKAKEETTKINENRKVAKKVSDVNTNIVHDLIKSKKKDLPELINIEKRRLVQEIKDFASEHEVDTVSDVQILEVMSKGVALTRTRYSFIELGIAFEIFKEIASMLSTVDDKFVPSKQLFCMYVGISTQTYDQYKESEEPEMRDVISKVEDYLTQSLEQAGQRGKIPFAMSMFGLKSKHGFVEEKETVGIIVDVNTDTNDIQNRLKDLRSKAIDTEWSSK